MVGGINRLLKDGQTPTSYKSTKSTKKMVTTYQRQLRLASKKANVVSLLVVRQTTLKLKHAHSHHVTIILLDTSTHLSCIYLNKGHSGAVVGVAASQ